MKLLLRFRKNKLNAAAMEVCSSSRRNKQNPVRTSDDISLTRNISRTKKIFTTASISNLSFTIIFLLCIFLVKAVLVTSTSVSAQDLPQPQSFYPGNPALRHRVRRYAENPQLESLVHDGHPNFDPEVKSEVQPQTANLGNLHKPNFTECSNYQPQIYEEQAPGVTVIQVRATDRDPYDVGGKISYSVIDATDSFSVDIDNGIVRTRKVFDRDEPAKEKEVYVTIKATDNGRPTLEAVCTIKVRVMDINDNKPMFDKYNYVETVPEDLEVKKIVTRISASDIDDGNNGTVTFRLERHPDGPDDINYFDITPQTGEVILRQRLADMRNKPKYYLQAIATDQGRPPMSSNTNITIIVVESNKKPPSIDNHQRHFELPETTFDKTRPILALTANSNTPDGHVFFEILNGPTQSSNKDNHFTIETEGNKAMLKLDNDKELDYESVTKYTLTIRASNKYNLATETLVTIEVTDENDIKPNFIEVGSGSILENEPAHTYVMKIRAIDHDGTSPNNEVTYYLKDGDKENFRIDKNTGEIWSMRPFDREAEEIYLLNVIARDGAPSVLTKDGLPNNRTTALKIEIKDRNDNPPVFLKTPAISLLENSNVNTTLVAEVRAIDKDTESVITYSIVAGDPDHYFRIETTSTRGIIYINKPLDFEKIQQYKLKVKASDSQYEAFTTVVINVENVNDNPPVFIVKEKNLTMEEETVRSGCIFHVEAYDPDIQDRSQPQNIVFYLDKGGDNFRISRDGCVTMYKGLDRDPGSGGYPSAQIIVGASDEGGVSPFLTKFFDLTVILTDINDNVPFINSSNPVVWDENQRAGTIIQLTADDFDEPKNGPPFTFRIDPSASQEIKTLFSIQGNQLIALKDNFDREEKKQYLIPVLITDSGTPQNTGTSIQTVIIGDENDNPMGPGTSKIFVYKYKEIAAVTIGRVYVEDKDDWDLPDKTFSWQGTPNQYFTLDTENGYIDALPAVGPGTYRLEFRVYDSKFRTTVDAIVEVIVKQITDEAIDNSGSIRFQGITKEEFIARGSDGRSKQDILRTEIARILGIENEDNVDVFTVMNSPHNSDPNILDVRYSAHNSPYYKPEKLDGKLSDHKDALEKALGVNIMMIRVDECLQERYLCESACTNNLHKSDKSYKIYTNTSSFVGVTAYIDPVCQCAAKLAPSSCAMNPCMHNGICQPVSGIEMFRCECEDGFYGKRCEVSSISLDGETYAWFPPLSVCDDSVLDIHFQTTSSDALILYNGPIYKPNINVSDFISLELVNGKPRLLMDYGSGVRELKIASDNLADAKDHYISIKWTQTEISITVDRCPNKDNKCFMFDGPVGAHAFLNVNGPLQIGGLSFDIGKLKQSMPWSSVPAVEKFTGCITNLSLNGQFYNLREPSFASGNVTTCDGPLAIPTMGGLGIGWPFIIIIIICLLILIILILSVVFWRRRKIYEEIKTDPNDDVRENIMRYDDDGGGEGDANFNLALLGRPVGGYPQSPTDKIPLERLYPVGRAIYNPEEPDMQSFVLGSKDRADRDPDGLPFDDVRNYAYEGDGNSVGSLSSLASGTTDSDLNFDFLPSFGPRFKKLADMYGGNSSDDASSTYSGA